MTRYIIVQTESIELFGVFSSDATDKSKIEKAAITSLEIDVIHESGPLCLDDSVLKADGVPGGILMVYRVPDEVPHFDESEVSADDVGGGGIFEDYRDWDVVGGLVKVETDEDEDEGGVYDEHGFKAVVAVENADIEDFSADDHANAVNADIRITAQGKSIVLNIMEWIDFDNTIMETDTAYEMGGQGENWSKELSGKFDFSDHEDNENSILDGLWEHTMALVQEKLNELVVPLPDDIGDPDDDDHIDLVRSVDTMEHSEQAAKMLGVEIDSICIRPGAIYGPDKYSASAFRLTDGRLLVISADDAYLSARIIDDKDLHCQAQMGDDGDMAELCDAAGIRRWGKLRAPGFYEDAA